MPGDGEFKHDNNTNAFGMNDLAHAA